MIESPSALGHVVGPSWPEPSKGNPVLLVGQTVMLRPLKPYDVSRLAEILQQPEVARWWPGYDEARVQREFLDAPRVVALGVIVDAELIGCVQYYEERTPFHHHTSIDVFLDAAWHGKRLGTDTIRTLARHLLYEAGHHRLTIDPPAGNSKAIRAFRRVGFKPIGTAREYARDPEGRWKDAVLMDLLKHDIQ